MENYKLFTWTAQIFCGPSFEVSHIALTADEARAGIFKQFDEIKQARLMDEGKIEPIHFKPRIHTDFTTDYIGVGLLGFTHDTPLENNILLGDYITHNSPEIRPLNLTRIMVNSY
jgi:hypothetical protein